MKVDPVSEKILIPSQIGPRMEDATLEEENVVFSAAKVKAGLKEKVMSSAAKADLGLRRRRSRRRW